MKTASRILCLILSVVMLITANITIVEAAVSVAVTEKLVATPTAGSVELSWKKVNNATGYKVYQVVDGKLKAIKTVSTTKHVVKDLTASETYTFAVKTYRKVDSKTYWSNSYKSVKVTTKNMGKTPTPKATATKNTVTLTWSKVEGATGYRIYQYSTTEKKYVTKATIEGKTSYKVTGLKVDTTYKFKIKPYAKTSKKTVWGKESSVVSIKTVDKTKAKFNGYVACVNEITLKWDKVPNATHYTVYVLKNGEYTKVATAIEKTSYKVKKLDSNKKYTFAVRGYKKAIGKDTQYTLSEPLAVKTKKAHTIVTDPAVAATCTKTGLTAGKHCSVCGTVTAQQKTVAKKAHSYTSSVTKQATCKATGVRTYKCSCGASYTENIAKKAHKIVIDPAVAATCTKTGLTEGKHCSVCGTVTVAQKTVAKSHNYTSSVTKQPTCKAVGVKTYKCSCGSTYTESIAKKAHTLATDPAVAATCTKTGLTEGKHCSICGTVTVAQKTVAKKSHSYTPSVTKQPTCTSTGVITYKCSCGESYNYTVDKTEHTVAIDCGFDATCIRTGLTEGKHCTKCQLVIVNQSTIPLKDHYDNNKDGRCDYCNKALTNVEPTTPPTTEPSNPDGLTAYRIMKYKEILEKETIYFKISTALDDGKVVPVEFARKNGNMYLNTFVELVENIDIESRIYYDKATGEMKAYADLGCWVYYDIPENEKDDMAVDEMLDELKIKYVGDITVSKANFNGKSVIKESFYNPLNGYTMSYYFDDETLVGIVKEHPRKVTDTIYVEKISNTVSDSYFEKPKGAIPMDLFEKLFG